MKKLDKKNIEDVLALTPMQEGMLFQYLKDPTSDYYFEQLSLEISGEIDAEIFKKAWNFVIETNEMLRTVFRWENVENPVQIILKEHKLQLQYYDLPGEESSEKKKWIERIKSEDMKKGFDLREVPFRVKLCKWEKAKYEMIISNHHILYDGWSNGIILNEFFKAYDDLSNQKELVKRVKTKFKEFVKWSRSQDKIEQENFWRNYLKGFDTQTELSVKRRKRKEITLSITETFKVSFSRDLKDKIEDFVKSHKITLASLLYSAWGTLLLKYNDCDEVIYGTTVSGRTEKIEGIENIIGLFINTIPLKVQVGANQKIEDLLYRINNTMQMREEYDSTPLVDIKKYSQLDHIKEIFDSIVIIENYPLGSRLMLANSQLSIDSYSMLEMTHYDLSISIEIFNDISFIFTYNKKLFDENTIVRLSHHLTGIVNEIITKPAREIWELEITPEQEKHQILYEFNRPAEDYPRDKTIIELFEGQVDRSPDNIALVGMEQSAQSTAHGTEYDARNAAFSYKELNAKSHQLAHLLTGKGVKSDTIVGIIMERSMEMVMGILGILKAGGTYLPIDPDYPEERRNYMLADSGAKTLLSGVSKVSEEIEIIDLYKTKFDKDFPTGPPQHPHRTQRNIAYIIYTSGSTGRPKGVMVEHISVVNLLTALQRQYPFVERDVYLFKTSIVFDVSVTELFGWFLGGGRLALLEKGAEKNPQKILDTIEAAGVTHINFVPSMFNVFMDSLTSQDSSKLSGLKYIFLAGEVLLPELVTRFGSLNTSISLENIYGPTEGTVYSSWYSLGEWAGSGNIPIGKPLPNVRLYILDKYDHLQPVGVPGELCISGTGVAKGYLNNPELTAEKFDQDLWDLQDYHDKNKSFCRGSRGAFFSKRAPLCFTKPEGRIYKTGDLARLLPNGNIEFLGRKDRQVKIRGFRIELEEIENCLLSHPSIKEAVVTARENKSSENTLFAYVVNLESGLLSNRPNNMELREYLSRTLPDYMVPSHFIHLDQLPLTSTGKIDRKVLPELEIKSERKYIAPRNEIEESLNKIWSDVLKIEKEKIGIDDHFFELGGHSLKATTLMLRIHKELNVKVSLTEIFNAITIRKLAQQIKGIKKVQCLSIETTEKKEYYALSSAQKRLCFLQQLEEAGIVYNMPSAWILEGVVEKDRLEKTFRKLINRHEILRTSFIMVKEEAVQLIHDQVEFEIEYNDLKEVKVEVDEKHLEGTRGLAPLLRNFIRPFDLSKAPLLRVGLIELLHTPSALRGQSTQEGRENKYLLMFDMHHIISDGISMQIFIREFTASHQGEVIPELRIQYRDFSHWQNALMDSGAIKQQESYWLKCFAGEFPVLTLPYDFPRPVLQTHEGSNLKFKINPVQTQQLKQLTWKSETTTFILLLSVFNLVLSKLSGQEDIVVGSPVTGRSHPDQESLIGVFINTLALRNYPAADRSFDEFLAEVKKNSLDAYENQDYQYEELVEKIEPHRDLSRNPLFDVMLVVPNLEMEFSGIQGIALRPVDYPQRTSKFDMTITAVEKDHRIDFTITYRRTLFTEETIRRFINYFKRVLVAVLKNTRQKITEIDILADDEKKQLLYGFNLTDQSYPGDKTIHRLFEEQAEQTPDHIALVGKEEGWKERWIEGKKEEVHLSYRELNEMANQLGQLLRKEGVKRETISGIMMDPSPEMIIGILAVLKAGGAYLPIDAQQQAGRITYMLKDSRAVLLLTREHVAHAPGFGVPSLDIARAAVYTGKGNNPERKSSPADVVYTIYTSGTTGKSKGTLIENKNLVNYVYWFKEKVHLTGRDRTVLTSSFSFDLGYTAIYSSILTGCQLHIIPRETYQSPEDLIGYINQHGISYIKITPSLFTTIVENSKFSQTGCRMLRLVVLGGEEIKLKDVEKAHRIAGHLHFMNHYGPTEATIGCVAQFIDFSRFSDYRKRPTIGHPIHNMKVAILDNRLKLVPIGVPGELSVSGASVARGYLNQPELTARKFFPVSHMFTRPNMSYMSYIYKTGDMARWTSWGVVEFLGRIDTQVKIRGYRIELGEIENRLLTHEAINETVVVPREHPSADKYLCAYIVLKNPGSITIPALREYLAVELPDYMIPSFFVELERIPLTPNGKLNRKLLPEPEIGSLTVYYAAPRDLVEKRLVELWQEILEVDRIGIDDHFFQLGGHSLKAVILISGMNKAFHVNVPLAEIFKTPTIRGLSTYIKSKKQGIFTPIEPEEKKDYHTLSSAQKRLYILHQMDESSTGYNMPYALRLEGEVNKNEFEDIFLRLIARHESLRTSFRMLDGVPVQKIHDDVEFEIEYKEVEVEVKVKEERFTVNWKSLEGTRGFASLSIPATRNPQPATALISSFIRPFDLSRAPLLRVRLIKESDQKHILMVDMHHTISDGISRRELVSEFMALAAGKDFPPLRLQYKDFSEWQNSEAQQEAQFRQKAYWKEELAGKPPVLDLPIDYVRPTIQRFEGSTVAFEIGKEEVKALQSLALAEGMTLYMILLGTYYTLLSKLSNQEDILVGTPTAGRRHADLQQIIGMFVNTLVLRNYPTGDKTYRGFLKEIKDRSLQAFENQDYPYEGLVEEVAITRDASRNPLFDTMFMMQNMEIPRIEIPGLTLIPYEHQIKTSKFDLTLMGMEIEEKLLLSFEYSTNLFKKVTIEKFAAYLKKIVSTVAANPDVKICDLEILSVEEKNLLLLDFNNTLAGASEHPGYPVAKTIEVLFEEQVERSLDYTAVVGPEGHMFLSYREFNKRTNLLARSLRASGVGAGGANAIVGIMVERSIEMVTGIFAILKAGGAYLPIDPASPKERVKYILGDSKAQWLLTQKGMEKGIEIGIGDEAEVEVMNLEDTRLYKGDTGNLPKIHSPGDLAYIIYTSGSTGRPKGVLIAHGSVVNVLATLFKQYPFSSRDSYLFKTSYTFDVSVTELFGWFLGGGRLAILGQKGERDPGEILDTIERCGISHINFVPSMFGAFLEILPGENPVKLSSLKYIFLAGEALLPFLVKRFMQLHSDVLLENIYGPTESTIYTTSYSLLEWEASGNDSIPIGKPLSNIGVYILDKYNHLQAVGVPGELCIRGVGLAQGYLNRPGLTGEKFVSSPFLAKERMYRTGDLTRWLGDGNIEFLGRLDQQVKVRGFRIELGEIENQLLKHEEIKEVVVVAKEDETGDRYLAAFMVSCRDREISLPGLRDYLLKVLPDYMIPSYFMQVDEIPLTPAGKINRRALPIPEAKAYGEYIAPRDKVEKALAEIWAVVLGKAVIGKERIGIDDNFFTLGGHSLKATVLVSKIHQSLNVKLPLMEVFKRPTIRRLSGHIHRSVKKQYASIVVSEKREYYTLSSAQKRLYFLQQLEEAGIVYNMPSAWILEGVVEKDRLEKTFRKLIHRHEILRTSFIMVKEEAVQLIHDQVEFEIEYNDLKDSKVEVDEKHLEGTRGLASLLRNFIRPFDLSHAPLLRVELVHLPHTPTALRGRPSREGKEDKYLLMVDMHHIVTDGISVQLLVRDFMVLYPGKELTGMRLRYKDYAGWQTGEKERIRIQEQSRYWQKEFAGEIPVLDLPTDYVRPTVQRFEGDSLGFEIDREPTRALNALALEQGATLYMVLLAVYTIFLSKLSNREDIVIGTPVAGRRHADLEKIIGMFVNTLALRHYPTGEKTFSQFLVEVKEKTLQAFENQEYQYEDLVEQVVVNRDVSRNPLFDVSFLFQNMEVLELAIPGLKLTPYEYETVTSKFDLTLMVVEAEERLQLKFEYSTSLFKKTTIERFIEYLKRVLLSAREKPGRKISEIEIISDEEKKQILFNFNNTKTSYPEEKLIHQLFEEQVVQRPENIAVVGMSGAQLAAPGKQKQGCREISLTYRELNEKVNQLAHLLRKKGIEPGSIVGIMVERSPEMIAGILGILKAGGAYLPVNPDYPDERIKYVLEDSAAKLLVTRKSFLNSLSLNMGMILFEDNAIYTDNRENLKKINRSRDLVYVIYTSGSTGKPKGVMIEHRSVVNRLNWMQRFYPIGETDVLLQKTPFTFDVSVWELFWWSMQGASVCLLGPGDEKSPEAIIEAVSTHKVTTIHFVPSMLNVFLEYIKGGVDVSRLRSLTRVFTSGEALGTHHLEGFNRCLKDKTGSQLINLYGPTEATVDVSYFNCTSPGNIEKIPIGKPIDNIKLYVVDKHLHLQAVGIQGELCISGDGVARGYLNRPELTAEKFDQDLWDFQDYHDKKNKSFCGGSRGAVFSKSAPLAARGKKIYKTGDLARWLPDGNIQFDGRLDHQVKIRGFRVELGEIESRLLSHKSIKEAVVISREDPRGDRYLCAYIVLAEEIDVSDLKAYLQGVLPGYMIPAYFVQLEQVPLTPSGKVDRKALPQPEIKPGRDEAPRDEIEKELVKIWADILGVENNVIGIHHNFFQLGGHSLKAALVTAKIHKAFSTRLALAEIFKNPTIKGLAASIKRTVRETFVSIEPVTKKDCYALSSAQKRIFILQQMDLTNTAYNGAQILELEEKPDCEKFENIFGKLIQRHESLRTSFKEIDGVPMQQIHETIDVEFAIKYYKTSESKVNKIVNAFIKAFDLAKPPLFRAALIEMEERRYLLVVDIHHIITDGISNNILIEDLVSLYSGEELPPLKLQYKDFSEGQSREKSRGSINEQKEYWLNMFKGEIPVLNLPIDYPRPLVKSFEGGFVSFELNEEEVAALRKIALAEGVTLFMVLLSIYYILLSRLSLQEDIVIGTPEAGRRHSCVERVVGIFINTLSLRNYPILTKRFPEFLLEVKERTLKAFDNQNYQFEDLVEAADIRRDTSRNPLFDVMFDYHNELSIQEIQAAKGIFKSNSNLSLYEKSTSMFDLNLHVLESSEGLKFVLDYCTKLFKKATILRFTRYFTEIVFGVIRQPDQWLFEIEMIPGEEKHNILHGFNDNDKKTDFSRDMVLQRLFEDQVERTPDHIATIFDGRELSYKELNTRANRVARKLRKNGITSGFAGVIIDRTPEMIAAVMGILKAGGAYVPLEPYLPDARIIKILDALDVRCILTNHLQLEKVVAAAGELPGLPHVFCLDEVTTPVVTGQHGYPGHNLPSSTKPENIAYTIYTSGSTGIPKGVVVKHRPVINVIQWVNKTFNVGVSDKLLFITSLGFDLSVYDIFGILASGGSIRIVSHADIRNPERLLAIIFDEGITFWDSAPASLQQLVPLFRETKDYKSRSKLRLAFLSGDWIPVTLPDALRETFKGVKVISLGGATEATIWSNYYPIGAVDPSWNSIPYGKPIQNAKYYILDQRLHICPIGVTGALYIGGECLATGYINDLELTSTKFIDNPFVPGEKIYMTGDIARWFEDGNMEFLGRMDNQVKLRGLRIELGEIEAQLLNHEAVTEVVVIIRGDRAENKYLCAYIVPKADGEIAADELREYLAKQLPDFMIPSYFVTLEQIPLTSNGKVDRKSLPEPDRISLSRDVEYVPPADSIEEKLAEIWSKILEIEKEKIGMNSDFFKLGGNSLKAIILITNIHKELHVKFPLIELFTGSKLKEMSKYIRGTKKDKYESIKIVEEKDYYPLSASQKRLYILHQMDETNTNYNITEINVLEKKFERERYEEAFKKLIKRHESFRTSFCLREGEPVQKIHKEVEFAIEYFEIQEGGEEKGDRGEREEKTTKEIVKNFVKPFDFSKVPLLRVGVIHLHTPALGPPFQEGMFNDKDILMLDMHHIISDGVSNKIVMKDFMAFFSGEDHPPQLRLRYKDYAQWQHSRKVRKTIKKQGEYWIKEFEGNIPILYLPIDYERAMEQQSEGDMVFFEIEKENLEKLRTLEKTNNVTMFMIFLAVYNIFFLKLTGQTDIIIGTPVAGRTHPDLEHIVGMFVNTLAMRNFLRNRMSFGEFLNMVKQRTLQAFSNQDYQFDDLVNNVVQKREPGRNPLFDVLMLFNSHREDDTKINLEEWNSRKDLFNIRSNFDLNLVILERKENVLGILNYSTNLFKKETMERFCGYFKQIISTVVKNKDILLGDIAISSDLTDTQLDFVHIREDQIGFGF